MSHIHDALPKQHTHCVCYIRPDTISMSHDTHWHQKAKSLMRSGGKKKWNMLKWRKVFLEITKGFPLSITSKANTREWCQVLRSANSVQLKHTEPFHTTQFDGTGCRGHCKFASKEIFLEAKAFSYSPGLGRHKIRKKEDHLFFWFPSVDTMFNSPLSVLCLTLSRTLSSLP